MKVLFDDFYKCLILPSKKTIINCELIHKYFADFNHRLIYYKIFLEQQYAAGST